MKTRLQAFFVLLISGCIGTDYLEDPVVGERIDISPLNLALMPEQSTQLQAVYFDQYGIEQDVMLVWTSSAAEVVSVDNTGHVTAKGLGQATITAAYHTAISEGVNVTVVADEYAVAVVEVSSPTVALEIGEKVMLTAVVKNVAGVILTGRELEWFSENPAIVAINTDGEVEAISNGLAAVHAKAEGVKSNIIDFVIGSSRIADFVSAGGYKTQGKSILRIENGKLLLDFDDSFKTSFALGTYIYLSNSTSGSGTFSNGVEISQILTSGAKSFDISTIDATIGLYDYRYVIVLCKPARVTFGYADMNE